MSGNDPAAGPRHEEMADLLVYYELDGLAPAERAAFEDHLLACDACLAELERGWPVLSAIRDRREEILPTVAPAVTEPESRSWWAVFRQQWNTRGGGFRIAVPAFAAVMLIAGTMLLADVRERQGYRELATFPREERANGTLRAPGLRDAVDELLETGAGYYDLGQYENAARYFEAALERSPDRADAAYLLGMARIFEGDIDEGIVALDRSVRSAGPADDSLAGKASWALANAYLADGRVSDARRTLDRLAAAGGDYGARARELRSKIDS